MSTPGDVHDGLHSEAGAARGEHPGRHPNPAMVVMLYFSK